MIKMIRRLFSKKKQPVHGHSMCPSCSYIRTDKVGILDVDLYLCHVENSDLWKLVRVYGPNCKDYKSTNACI